MAMAVTFQGRPKDQEPQGLSRHCAVWLWLTLVPVMTDLDLPRGLVSGRRMHQGDVSFWASVEPTVRGSGKLFHYPSLLSHAFHHPRSCPYSS